MDNFQLVLFIGSEVSESQGSLALNSGRFGLCQANEQLNESRFGLGQLLAVRGVDSDIAQSSGAVVLHIQILGCEKLDEHRNSASIDKGLSVLILGAVSHECSNVNDA